MKFEEVRDVLEYYDIEIDPRKGNPQNYLIRCPFHNDYNPSCSIRKDSGLFHCFACGEEGSIITFIMKLEKCDYDTAKKLWLGEEELITLKEKEVLEPEWERGFLDILKRLDKVFFGVDNEFQIKNNKRELFLKVRNNIMEDWFYFNIIDNPQDEMIKYAENMNDLPELKTILLGGQKSDKLNL